MEPFRYYREKIMDNAFRADKCGRRFFATCATDETWAEKIFSTVRRAGEESAVLLLREQFAFDVPDNGGRNLFLALSAHDAKF